MNCFQPIKWILYELYQMIPGKEQAKDDAIRPAYPSHVGHVSTSATLWQEHGSPDKTRTLGLSKALTNHPSRQAERSNYTPHTSIRA